MVIFWAGRSRNLRLLHVSLNLLLFATNLKIVASPFQNKVFPDIN